MLIGREPTIRPWQEPTRRRKFHGLHSRTQRGNWAYVVTQPRLFSRFGQGGHVKVFQRFPRVSFSIHIRKGARRQGAPCRTMMEDFGGKRIRSRFHTPWEIPGSQAYLRNSDGEPQSQVPCRKLLTNPPSYVSRRNLLPMFGGRKLVCLEEQLSRLARRDIYSSVYHTMDPMRMVGSQPTVSHLQAQNIGRPISGSFMRDGDAKFRRL